jgi:hypothetical protein
VEGGNVALQPSHRLVGLLAELSTSMEKGKNVLPPPPSTPLPGPRP